LVFVKGTGIYFYIYDESEAGAESSPDIIIPDDNSSGTGAWVLEYVYVTHAQLSDVGTDDHHSRYTDSEAVSAVNAEASLSVDITGDADTVDGQHASAFAPASKGVTNGDSHDHSGGDGGTISHGSLSGVGASDHHSRYTDSEAVAAVEGSNITQGDGNYIATDQVKARDSDGLQLTDDGGNGMTVQDGGDVAFDGGIYLGGTDAENYIESKDVGVLHTTATAHGGGTISLDPNNNAISWELFGDFVRVGGKIAIASKSGASGKVVFALPFVRLMTGEGSHYSLGSAAAGQALPTGVDSITCLVLGSDAEVSIFCQRSSGWGSLQASEISAGDQFIFNVCYRTA
jgi:hypothetical protein